MCLHRVPKPVPISSSGRNLLQLIKCSKGFLARISLLISTLILVPTKSNATGDGGLPGYFLNLGANARNFALGKTGVATSLDSTAVYFNPGLLPRINRTFFSSTYHNLFAGTKYFTLDFVPLPYTIFGKTLNSGVGFTGLWSDSIESRDEWNTVTNPTLAGEANYTLFIAQGIELHRLISCGLGIKLISHTFSNTSGFGLGLDFGVHSVPIQNLSIGLNLQNLITPVLARESGSDIVPLNFKFGVGYSILNNRLSGNFDLGITPNKTTQLHLGVEFIPVPMLSLRVGLVQTMLTAGIGFKMHNVAVDYALANNVNLGIEHRVSVSLFSKTKQEIDDIKTQRETEIAKIQAAKRLDVENKLKLLSPLIEQAEKEGLPTANYKTALSNIEKEMGTQNYDTALSIANDTEKQVYQALSSLKEQPQISKAYVKRTFDATQREKVIQNLKSTAKVNLAVAEFTVRAPVTTDDASLVSELLRGGLVKSECFNVIDRAHMAKILEEQKLQVSGLTDEEMAIKIGKLLNVQKMFTGTLGKLVDQYLITLSVVDVETGKTVYFDKVSCTDPRDFPTAIEDTVGSFLDFLGK